jgi:hypothetical protein
MDNHIVKAEAFWDRIWLTMAHGSCTDLRFAFRFTLVTLHGSILEIDTGEQ